MSKSCEHTHIRLTGDSVCCDTCPAQDMPLTIESRDLAALFLHIEDVAQTLELAGMVDTAQGIRDKMEHLVVEKQVTWRRT